ncbi:hypothetical protein [Algibacter marinivivus]|nr:hypothetical protein [Algibacter marinivivus]
METNNLLHNANIIMHVIFGSTALALGLIALLSQKGNKLHKKSGKLFLWCLIVVIITGLIGVFIFNRNTFLLVITADSAYLGFSGYRVLKNKSNKLKLLDVFVAILTLMSVSYFLYCFKSIGMIWSPIIIYSTVGYLLFIITYDFLRYLVPKSKYKNLWLYEHILKMVSAFSAILSAFSGTVFEDYQPYSQFLPSTLCMVIAIGFIIYYAKKNKSIKR